MYIYICIYKEYAFLIIIRCVMLSSILIIFLKLDNIKEYTYLLQRTNYLIISWIELKESSPWCEPI